jgi:ERCC4-type nuclease
MRPSPISILLDSNEKGSDRAKALALAVGGDPTYDLQGFAELPVDMTLKIRDEDPIRGTNLCNISESVVHVELKEIPDFWASKGSGHLGQQVLEIVAQGQPGFVAVFGSLHEVMESVPKMKMWENMSGCKKPQRRSQMDIASDVSTARAFCADATACGVPVFFLSTNHQQSFAWILSMAKNILTGPSMSSWLPRYPVEPRGYGVLCAIPGIGDVAARGLLEAYGSVGQIVNMAHYDPDALASCKINGKALGKAKASKLAEVLG